MYDSSIFLTPEQIDKLRRVLTPTIPIYPSPQTSSFPTLHITPKDFLRQLSFKLKQHSIDVSSIRLHGGAASYVLVNNSDFVYRDIDILFLIKTSLSSQQQTTLFSSNNEPYLCDVWTIIKYVISSCLIEHIPNSSSCTQYFISSVLDTYSKKNIKISSEQDSWALLSLQNLLGQNLELKFVENLKRQWQFSVDSFQIDLTLLLSENSNESSLNVPSITKKTPTKRLVINAINGLTIVQKNKETDHYTSTSPLQFGFFSPSSLSNINGNEDNIHCQTLATITTHQTSTNHYASGSRSSNLSKSDNRSNSSLQFQLSMNEDIDDGIEIDADDSSNEDDDHVSVDTNKSATIENFCTLLNSIRVYSVYNNVKEALYHLNHKLIATYEPETMRGGGLLKYCDLLARNYKLYNVEIMHRMQRYMCSRFFIDYKTLPEQIHVIAQYVTTHFLPSSIITPLHTTNNLNEIFQHCNYSQNQISNSKYDLQQIDRIELINARLCLLFFEHLQAVIHGSTVCLTHKDKQLLLLNIHNLKENYRRAYEHLFFGNHHAYNYIHSHYGTNSSSNSSRSSSPSSSSSKSYGYNPVNTSHNPYIQRNLSYRGWRTYSGQQTAHRYNHS